MTEPPEPLFRFTLSLHHADGGAPVRFQDDGEGKYVQQYSLKLLSGVDYLLSVTIRDIGKTVEGLSTVHVDDNELEIVGNQESRDETHDCAIFTVQAKWILSSLHFGPTPHGIRDQIPVEIRYMHAGRPRSLTFDLQAKLYDCSRPKRVKKATTVGGPLKGMETRYDASKATAALRWTFEEQGVDEANPLVGISSWRPPPRLASATPTEIS